MVIVIPVFPVNPVFSIYGKYGVYGIYGRYHISLIVHDELRYSSVIPPLSLRSGIGVVRVLQGISKGYESHSNHILIS